VRKQKIVLLAFASAALSGPMVKADFTLTGTRQVGAVVNPAGAPAGSYDLVRFTLTGTGTSNGAAASNSITAGLYAASGMLIGVGSGAKGSVATNQADIFATNWPANVNDSWIGDNTSPFTLISTTSDANSGHGAVLLMGNTPSGSAGVDPTGPTTFTQNELVAGIYGTIFNSSGTTQATPIYFAQAVVPTNATVFLLDPSGTKGFATANTSRLFGPSSGIFSPGGGFSNAAVNDLGEPFDPNPIPEPVSIFGIGIASLLVRRRSRFRSTNSNAVPIKNSEISN
jgi:hypothetical protein